MFGGRALPRAWQQLNTDFPNYYVTAHLLREGYNTNRVYEWIWLQRQKDRMGIKPSDPACCGFSFLTLSLLRSSNVAAYLLDTTHR